MPHDRNFLLKRELRFNHNGEEFLIQEMCIKDFFSVVDALEELLERQNILPILEALKLPEEVKIKLLTDVSLFENFLSQFFNLHSDRESLKQEAQPEQDKTTSTVENINNFFKTYKKVFAKLWEITGTEPEKLSNYSIRQIDLWVKEFSENNKPEDKNNDSSAPAGAKKYKKYTDKYGRIRETWEE